MQSHALTFDLASRSWSGPLPPADSPRTLVLAFGAPELIDAPAPLQELAAAYPRSVVIGCSSAGEIHGTAVQDRSIAATVTRFDRTELLLASLEVKSPADSATAGAQLARKLAAKPGLRGVLVLSEGLNVNGSELIRGLNSVLDESVVVTGGLSGDGPRFQRTWVAVGGTPCRNLVAAVGFYGNHVTIGHGSKGGWDKFGPERLVTRSEGNVLYELDGRPALQLYQEYLGDKAKDLPASGLLFPLSVRASTADPKFVVRTLLSVDRERNALVFAGDIPKGHLAQLMKADFDRLIDGAGVAGAMTVETGAAPANADALVIAISCVGRRLVLGARTEEEIEAVRDAVRSDRARITGFYSYGEISPYATGHCDLHNQTMTLTMISETAVAAVRPAAVAGAGAARPPAAAQAAMLGTRRPTGTGLMPTVAPRANRPSPAPPMPARAQPAGHVVRQALYDLATRAWSEPLPELDSPRTLVLGFGAPELADDPRPFVELARAYPQSVVIGCSSAGEIHGTTVRDRTLAVTVSRFDKTDLQLVSLPVASAADSAAVGAALAKKLAATPGLRGVLVLSEGLNVNGSELIRGLNSVLDESVVVTGGLSGDGPRFQRTWVAVGAQLGGNVVAAVGFYGDHVTIGHGSKGGWDKFGPERLVTRSEGNVLYELDGRPALQLYKEYLGDKAKDLPASGLLFPLSLRASTADQKFVVRTLLSVDHERSSLVFAGDIPRGHLAQLMKADFDRLIDGAGVAGAMTAETGAPPPHADSLVIAISCVGRRLVLGARTEEEIEAVRDAVRSDRARITGFYSYGEISPYATGHCDLHNQTMTLTVVSESPLPIVRRARGTLPSMKVVAPPPALVPASTPAPDDTDAELAVVAPRAAAGFAVATVSYDQAARAWSAPLPELDSPRTLVLGFGAPELVDDPRAFVELARAYPRSLVIGCSSAGEIHGTSIRDRSVAVTVTRFDRAELQLASLEVRTPADSAAAGAQLAKKLAAKPGLRGVLVLSEGLNVNGSELIRGLNSVLDESVVVTGGLSGDGPRFQRTWVAVGGTLRGNTVAAVGFYGDHVTIGHGSHGGWDKFGPEREVTRSEGNILFELDGRPALQLYKEYLGDKAKDLPASGLLFPLSLRASTSDRKFVVRTLLSVDRERNALVFAGDIPKGHLAQLMKADFDRLIDGAGVAGTMTVETGAPPPDTDALVIAISCVGRRLVLGARTEEELEAVRDAVHAERAHITGFYSYGEISPYATGHCDLHNQTMTLTVVSESPIPLARPAVKSGIPVLHAAATNGGPVSHGGTTTGGGGLTGPVLRPRDTETVPMPVVPRARAEARTPAVAPRAIARPAPAPTAPPVAAPARRAGPIVRLPHASGTDAAVDVSTQGELQLVRIRGRLTESFKGDPLGRTLAGRVAFDLADVDRVTSFGVREWLAMLGAASRITESYLFRCSESVVNQLTMIRKFDGGARIASLFAPYLCESCGAQLERLIDCERDAAELAAAAPAPVACPRCAAQARFDDDPRTYFAFVASHVGVELPPEVRALHDALAAQADAPAAEEIEKSVERDETRIRVHAKLSGQIRWRKIFDGIEGALVVDLAATPVSDDTGVANLEQALRALPPEVAPIRIEGAPVGLIEHALRDRGLRRIQIASAAVVGYCASCAVNRPAIVAVDRYAADVAAGRAHQVVCKRCNGDLELAAPDALRQLVEARAVRDRPSPVPAAAAAAAAAPAAAAATLSSSAAPRARGVPWLLVVVGLAIAGGLGAVAFVLATRGGSSTPPAAATAAPPAEARPPAPAPAPTPTPAAAPGSAAPAAWQDQTELPPAWVEREISIDAEAVLVVGHAVRATPAAALEAARQEATLRLLQQVYGELAGTPVHDFVARRIRPGAADTARAVAERFAAQRGADTPFERVDASTRRTPDGVEIYARYRVARRAYDALVAGYRATVRFRGAEVAAFFPLLETALPTTGQLVVIAVERRSAADYAGVREGDAILKLGAQPVTTVEAFRAASAQAWSDVAPGGRLALELESAGAPRTATMIKPVPQP